MDCYMILIKPYSFRHTYHRGAPRRLLIVINLVYICPPGVDNSCQLWSLPIWYVKLNLQCACCWSLVVDVVLTTASTTQGDILRLVDFHEKAKVFVYNIDVLKIRNVVLSIIA